MHVHATSWARDELSAEQKATIRASLDDTYRVAFVAGGNRGDWTVRIWRSRELVAAVHHARSAFGAFREALAKVAPLSIVWCGDCDAPAVGEDADRAWCDRHRYGLQEAIA